jgi:hypothetical protein
MRGFPEGDLEIPFEQKSPDEGVDLRDEDGASAATRRPSPSGG